MKNNLVKIRILSTGEVFLVKSDPLSPGQEIVVESNGIIEPAVSLCRKNCSLDESLKENACLSLGMQAEIKILRVFTEDDKVLKEDLKKEVLPYLAEAQKKVFRHGLSMEILDADFSHDRKKLTFYFTAESRVDFRSLVADMAGDFGKIIRLQQVGAREEAAIMGGLGRCGRPLCCASFLNNFDNVNIKVSELNEAGLKPTKNIGCCGRPMCCLSFESAEQAEKQEEKKSPKIKKEEKEE